MIKNIPNPPLSHAVVEVSFNPVAAMGNYVNEIQDKLRKKGYTNFRREHNPHSEASLEIESSPNETNTERILTWLISKPDETSGFTLGTTDLSFHATNYESYSELVSELLAGLHFVHEVVSLDHISQLGFRNLNFVTPDEGDIFSSSYQADSGVQQQYALSKSVFKTDCGSPDQKGYLSYKFHRASSASELLKSRFVKKPVIERKLAQAKVMTVFVTEIEHSVEGPISFDFAEIQKTFHCLFVTADSTLDAVASRELDKTENSVQDSMLKSPMVKPTLSGDFDVGVLHARSLPDVRTVPEHIENIRTILKPKMADLAAIFDVSRQAIYKWISGETKPEDETIDRVYQLSRISDQFREANVFRAETLLKMKTFDGLSLMDLIQSGEITDEHIDALIDEARAMESEYRITLLANSKGIPTDDWLSTISIPGSFEKD